MVIELLYRVMGGYGQLYMVIHGHTWLMVIEGYTWLWAVIHGLQ